nr:hypothetical protein CFP56_08776 [Quercus suber]
MTRFSKAKLAKAQEKKAKANLTGGLLYKKRQRENKPPRMILCSKAKATGRASISSFWEDTKTKAQKANDAIFVEGLEPLMEKPPYELMSSHVLGKFLYILGKYLDYDKKLTDDQFKAASLSTKNESPKSQISALADKAKKDKDRLTTLEKSIDTEKAFSKLKDKQIDEALLKVKKAGTEVVEKFKVSDKYSDKLYDYYVDGFDPFSKILG